MTDAASNSPHNAQEPKISPIATAINILAAPAEAFKTLQAKPTVLFPLAIIALSTIVIQIWYFSILDMAWFADDIIANFGDGFSEEQAEGVRDLYTGRSQNVMALTAGIGGAVSLVVLYLLQAGYLTLTSALGGDGYRFKNWFSLVCWTSLPYLLSVIGMAVTIALSPNGQLSAFDLDPLSLANLGMNAGGNSTLQSLFTTVSLTMLWSLGLVVLGYKQWLNASWLKSVLVVTAPYLLIFGIWFYIALTGDSPANSGGGVILDL